MALHQQNFTGQHAEFIGNELTGTVESGGFSDILRELFAQRSRGIGRESGAARESIRESGASSGFRGANANLFNQLFAEESGARSELTTGIGRIAEDRKRQALEQLGILTRFQGQQQLGGAQFREGQRQFDISTERGREEFAALLGLKKRELDILEESQPGFFENLVTTFAGGVIGGATGGLSTAIGTGLSSLFSSDPDPQTDRTI